MRTELEEQYKMVLDALQKDALPIVCWGDVLDDLYTAYFASAGLTIDAICDRDKRKKLLDGKNIILPSEVDDIYKHSGYNAVIVIPHLARVRKEIATLKHQPKRIFYLDVYRLHCHPVLFQRPQCNWQNIHAGELAMVNDLLEDDSSRETLRNVIQYWIEGSHSSIAQYANKMDEQYMDTISLGTNEVYLNLGACDGRVTKRFIKKVSTYSAIYNVEFDHNNCKTMEEELRGEKNCFIIEKGVWDSASILHFQSEGNSCSFVTQRDASRTIEIEADSVDSMFGNIPITFITADIEGSESRMLDGAKTMLKKYKPKLAISCYHQIDDLIQIPLKIKKINPSYRIKMRHYTDFLTDTVCYAY